MSRKLIECYYEDFNAGRFDAMLEKLDPEVIHDINEGEQEVGVEAFSKFLDLMNTAYKEKAVDLVIFESNANRLAAEFFIEGRYLQTQNGLPVAHGQNYRLRVGAFFEVKAGKIKRVSNYYNLSDWLKQVSQ